MSAPTYFTPLERFVDGGTTTYNNPSLAAILEATSDVTHFDLMKAIGEATVDYIRENQSVPFGSDLVDERNRDLLVSRFGDISRIKWNVTNTQEWLDNFPT